MFVTGLTAFLHSYVFGKKPKGEVLCQRYQKFLKSYGNNKYMIGEEISQKQHVTQAGMIAKLVGLPDNLVPALFLHDVGQFLGIEKQCKDGVKKIGNTEKAYLDATHDYVGGKYLEGLFGKDHLIPTLVKFHAYGKILLCHWNQEAYYQNLSHASKESIVQQMLHNHETYLQFQKLPVLQQKIIVALRMCDELAKNAFDVPERHIQSLFDLTRKSVGETDDLEKQEKKINKALERLVSIYDSFVKDKDGKNAKYEEFANVVKGTLEKAKTFKDLPKPDAFMDDVVKACQLKNLFKLKGIESNLKAKKWPDMVGLLEIAKMAITDLLDGEKLSVDFARTVMKQLKTMYDKGEVSKAEGEQDKKITKEIFDLCKDVLPSEKLKLCNINVESRVNSPL